MILGVVCLQVCVCVCAAGLWALGLCTPLVRVVVQVEPEARFVGVIVVGIFEV